MGTEVQAGTMTESWSGGRRPHHRVNVTHAPAGTLRNRENGEFCVADILPQLGKNENPYWSPCDNDRLMLCDRGG